MPKLLDKEKNIEIQEPFYENRNISDMCVILYVLLICLPYLTSDLVDAYIYPKDLLYGVNPVNVTFFKEVQTQ